MNIARSTSTAWLVIGCVLGVGCSSSPSDADRDDVRDAAAGSGSKAEPQASSQGGAPAAMSATTQIEAPTDESASAKFEGTFEACVAALKPVCNFDEKATPCASLRTPSIALSNGKSWGEHEIAAGPYGGFVAWNQGKEFANPVSATESNCGFIVAAFGEPPSTTTDILNLRGQDLALYTIFRPACMKDGEKYPVITWGNGTCGQTGGYASQLAILASHGFIVIASNSRFTGQGNNEMLKALDFAKALNEDAESIYYQKLDLDNIGAMGHSQGASATASAAPDARIKAVILWNGGLSSADKPFLAVSGDRDITGYTPMQMREGVEKATQPGAWLYYHQILETGGNVTGHLTIMEQPERVIEPTVAWWQYWLKGDQEAKRQFAGDDCGLCKKPEDFELGSRALP